METEDLEGIRYHRRGAESWHGALDRVFAKCNEEPFLSITVKL